MANPLSGIDEAGDAVRQVIRAYHGSPYDFDRVDMRKIGRGEGTADEGHGFYSAESPEVAEYYRDAVGLDRNFSQFFAEGRELDPADIMTLPPLRSGEKWRVLASWRENGQPVADLSAVDAKGNLIYVQGPARDAGGASPQNITRMWDANESNWRELGAVPFQHLHRSLPVPREYEGVVGRRPGNVYELEIRQDPRTLLDWDANFANQSAEVQRVLNQMRSSWEPELAPKLAPYGEIPTGEQIYRAIARGYAHPGGYEAAASRRLLDAGIPGIKYFDQLSRNEGQGTRNFVSFPGTEDSIRILRKYGMMAPIATGAMQEER